MQTHLPENAPSHTKSTETEHIHRKMKFIPKKTNFSTTRYSGIQALENYIYNTKETLDGKLSEICTPHEENLNPSQRKAITKFQRLRNRITIKPADKNLGIVILDTEDYLQQCTTILRDHRTYRSTTGYPLPTIKGEIERICAKFSNDIRQINKHLYEFLLPKMSNINTPKFYGIPKEIHKYTTCSTHHCSDRLPPSTISKTHRSCITTSGPIILGLPTQLHCPNQNTPGHVHPRRGSTSHDRRNQPLPVYTTNRMFTDHLRGNV